MGEYRRLRKEDLDDNGMLNLLEAFVGFIRADYIRIYNQVRDTPKNKKAIQNYNYIRGLVLSDYFGQLTGLDGKEVLNELENQCAIQYRRLAQWRSSTKRQMAI